MTVNAIVWPVTLGGFLGPARGTKVNQYEFYCHDLRSINANLPLSPDNPYRLTVSPVSGQRNKGLQVTCKFRGHSVLGQFHRHKESEGIWIGSDYTNRGSGATGQWHEFVSHFGIKVGVENKTVAVYLDFYVDPLKLHIRLR